MKSDSDLLDGLTLKGDLLQPLLAEVGGPFWKINTGKETPADYADGIEDLIADYNRQRPEDLPAWARAHPLTSEQRFILEYNTSSDRANALRSLPLRENDRVLEIGCGCGPVSQYLWERCQTLSIEASPARARAAAWRLRAHRNPHQSVLLCSDFYQLEGRPAFDWVVLNGVLEYAGIYSGAGEASPYVAMLRRAASFLKPAGRCVVAIENRLGLKYFAGAPEDHYGRPAVGLEGYTALAGRAPIRTFSRPALTGLFEAAGFAHVSYQFPFPDYKLAKVILPEDEAAWRFASARLIDTSPAWRGARGHHFDEAAAFRSLTEDGLADQFAHSFLATACKTEPAPAAPTSGLHYIPLRRDPHCATAAYFDLAGARIVRHRLDAKPLAAHPPLPSSAPHNPRARFASPQLNSARTESVQPIFPQLTLWEEFRQKLGHTVDASAVHQATLDRQLKAILHDYFAGLPWTANATWPEFLKKLRGEFARGGLVEGVDDVLAFLEAQRPFAETSLGQMKHPWCVWAPDWVLENLVADAGGAGVQLFDVEYVDLSAPLPTPAVIYRQLRILRSNAGKAALGGRWPWSIPRLTAGVSEVELPSPAHEIVCAELWPQLSPQASEPHAWFWAKVAEIVECAMTSTVVAPLTKAYETAPWLEKLGAELRPLTGPFAVKSETLDPADIRSASLSSASDELIAKEQQIAELAAVSQERERSLLVSSREADQLRTQSHALTHDLRTKEGHLLAVHEEASGLRSQLLAAHDEASQLRSATKDGAARLREAHAEIETLTSIARQRGHLLEEASREGERLRANAAQLTADLHAKEAVIQDLARACEERQKVIERLTAGHRG